MWIGEPGAMRQITDGAGQFDRSPDLGVTEFRSLEGGVTTWVPRALPRRLKLSWSAMQRGDVAHLDRLARRIDGLGPIAVQDPLSRNLLTGSQAAGLGNAMSWRVTGDITVWAFPYSPVGVQVTTMPATGYPELIWTHPYFHGVPVVPGQPYTWWTPGLIAQGAALQTPRVAWHDAARKWVSTSIGSTSGPLVAEAPPGAAYALPFVSFTATGIWQAGEAVFAAGDMGAALLAGERPPGEGCPPYSITRYTHAATDGDGAYRDIGLELVEVTA
ncbi:hypothetical protein AB0901_30945 [Streptomyces roseifaciens]